MIDFDYCRFMQKIDENCRAKVQITIRQELILREHIKVCKKCDDIAEKYASMPDTGSPKFDPRVN